MRDWDEGAQGLVVSIVEQKFGVVKARQSAEYCRYAKFGKQINLETSPE